MATDGAQARAARIAGLDFIKAACIVAVVLEHVRLPGWAPSGIGLVDHLLGLSWGYFHVPGFLFVSGYLYAERRDRVGPGWLRARLARLLVPYLVASAAVFIVGSLLWGGWTLGDAGFALATGSALGIYYYVFIATICVLVAWPLARVPDRFLLYVVLAIVVGSWLSRFAPPSRAVFWLLRDPLNMFVAYFAVGWWAARNGNLVARVAKQRWLAFALVVAGIGLWASLQPPGRVLPINAGARFVYSLAAIAGIALLVRGRRAPAWIVWLSQATYPIFLYHMLFIRIVRPQLAGVSQVGVAVAEGLAAALGAGLVIGLGVWLGGERGRRVLGMA